VAGGGSRTAEIDALVGCISKLRQFVHHADIPERPVDQGLGPPMHKSTIVLAAILAVCVSTGADAAKKKKAAAAAPAQNAQTLNANSARLVNDGLRQFFVPPQAMTQPAAPAKAAAKGGKKKKKKS
jgi:hypothetical protein